MEMNQYTWMWYRTAGRGDGMGVGILITKWAYTIQLRLAASQAKFNAFSQTVSTCLHVPYFRNLGGRRIDSCSWMYIIYKTVQNTECSFRTEQWYSTFSVRVPTDIRHELSSPAPTLRS
jgi:hypothetical protein